MATYNLLITLMALWKIAVNLILALMVLGEACNLGNADGLITNIELDEHASKSPSL